MPFLTRSLPGKGILPLAEVTGDLLGGRNARRVEEETEAEGEKRGKRGVLAGRQSEGSLYVDGRRQLRIYNNMGKRGLRKWCGAVFLSSVRGGKTAGGICRRGARGEDPRGLSG